MNDSNTTWKEVEGAIIERPRSITRHPLLDSIYKRHDELIAEFITGRTLEVAFGQYPHPMADIGVEAFPENSHEVRGIEAVTADARSLPFSNGSFQTIIGRRFLHHVPVHDRKKILKEIHRLLSKDGRLVLIEGTPGLYRKLTKGLAFRLGLLSEDNDEYGHLNSRQLIQNVKQAGFEIIESQSLGSPLMPLSIFENELVRNFIYLYERTQFIRWWTFIVSKPIRNNQ